MMTMSVLKKRAIRSSLQGAAILLLAVTILVFSYQFEQILFDEDIKLGESQRALSSQIAAVENYEAALEQLPWSIDSVVHKQPMNIAIVLEIGDTEGLSRAIKSTYDQSDIFLLRAFEMEVVRDDDSKQSSLRVRMKGEQILIEGKT